MSDIYEYLKGKTIYKENNKQVHYTIIDYDKESELITVRFGRDIDTSTFNIHRIMSNLKGRASDDEALLDLKDNFPEFFL